MLLSAHFQHQNAISCIVRNIESIFFNNMSSCDYSEMQKILFLLQNRNIHIKEEAREAIAQLATLRLQFDTTSFKFPQIVALLHTLLSTVYKKKDLEDLVERLVDYFLIENRRYPKRNYSNCVAPIDLCRRKSMQTLMKCCTG